jgi:rhamnogalacturonan acetylesterase
MLRLGWGQFFGEFTDLPVINKAIGGRSARSYTEQGRFQDVAKLVAPGDCESLHDFS